MDGKPEQGNARIDDAQHPSRGLQKLPHQKTILLFAGISVVNPWLYELMFAMAQ